jgi:hypothetical protein
LWTDVSTSAFAGRRPALLLGNGASIAVWRDFGYPSLYDVACDLPDDERLTPEEVGVFESLTTQNFEAVLRDLTVAERVDAALGGPCPEHVQHYSAIKGALHAALVAVHVPWAVVPAENLVAYRAELRQFGAVFTTNYDLLVYWAATSEARGAGFPDFFGNVELRFHAVDTGYKPEETPLYFLHGAIHLARGVRSGTRKRRSDWNGNLLESFARAYEDGSTPLLVTEGSSEQKIASIETSDYLSHCRDALVDYDGPIVVFGHRLAAEDGHIVEALQAARGPLYYGIHDLNSLREERLRIEGLLGDDVMFYASPSFPLASSQYRLSP